MNHELTDFSFLCRQSWLQDVGKLIKIGFHPTVSVHCQVDMSGENVHQRDNTPICHQISLRRVNS